MTDMDNAEYIRKACQGVKAPQIDYSTLSRDGLAINLSASHERAVILCVSLGELEIERDALQAKLARYEEVLRKVANEMLTTSLSYKFKDMARDVLVEGGG